MGAKLSAQNRKRVTSRLHATKSISNKKADGVETKNTNASYATLSSAALPAFTSSQSSDGIIRNGRTFHNEQTSTYWFPNDDEEIDRLVSVRISIGFINIIN